MQTLSLCMIVKDEENNIESCLKKATSIADEIVIVDTGSKDRTKEICKRYNARIYDFPWCGNFAAARNYGINKATGKWILWMDADEILEINDLQGWKKALASNQQLFWAISIINYIGDLPTDPSKAYIHAQWRVFRNGIKIRFINDIHEQLDLSELNVDTTNIKKLPAIIHHYGYMNEEVILKKKHERNLTMLLEASKKERYNPWVDYHLASEYYRIKEYLQAFFQLNKAIIHFLDDQQIPPSIVYKLKYDTLLAMGSYDGALTGIDKAIQMYPDYVDLYYYKGLLLFIKKQFEEAKKIFSFCLELGEEHVQHLVMRGVGSFHALYMIGKCELELGRKELAIDIFEKALRKYPFYEQLTQQLQNMKGKE